MATDEQVVYYEKKLIDILKGSSPSGSEHGNLPFIPKIQKVQPYLRQSTEFGKYYFPKLLSMGPIHHGDPNLKLGEHCKKRWTKAYLEDLELGGEAETEAVAKRIHQNIARNIEDLTKWYSEDAIREEYEGNDNYLAWMFFVDGCSLLHIININAEHGWKEASGKLKIKIDHLALLLKDLLLLENQLPHQLLSLLTDDMYKLEESMLKLFRNHNMLPESNPSPHSNNTYLEETSVFVEESHLLGLLHKTLLKSPPPSKTLLAYLLDFLHTHCNTKWPHFQTPVSNAEYVLRKIGDFTYRVRNIQELKAAGIAVKSTRTCLRDVKFTSGWFGGQLDLPPVNMDIFMNLTAYEMCPDFFSSYEITSYMVFISMLINLPDDVKELRSAGVLMGHHGNDKEVAKLFNIIRTDMTGYMWEYSQVLLKIEKHCSAKCKMWMAQVYHDHFSSPWTTIAFLAAALVTGSTMVQTWFTVWPAR